MFQWCWWSVSGRCLVRVFSCLFVSFRVFSFVSFRVFSCLFVSFRVFSCLFVSVVRAIHYCGLSVAFRVFSCLFDSTASYCVSLRVFACLLVVMCFRLVALGSVCSQFVCALFELSPPLFLARSLSPSFPLSFGFAWSCPDPRPSLPLYLSRYV